MRARLGCAHAGDAALHLVRDMLSHSDGDPLHVVRLCAAVLVGGGSDRRFGLTLAQTDNIPLSSGH